MAAGAAAAARAGAGLVAGSSAPVAGPAIAPAAILRSARRHDPLFIRNHDNRAVPVLSLLAGAG